MTSIKSRLGAMLLGALGMAVAFVAPASATPICQGVSSCTVNSIVYTETGGSSTATQIFLASFSPANQSPSTISTDVLAFLLNDGFTGVDYLGRYGGSSVDGDSIALTGNGGTTGTWTFTPGTTGDIAEFVAIHAGDGQTTYIYEFSPAAYSGNWATLNGHGLSNFDLFGADPSSVQVPEPSTASMFAGAFLLLASFGLIRRKLSQAATA